MHGSGHFIQNDRPEAVVEAILQVMWQTGADTEECQRADPQ